MRIDKAEEFIDKLLREGLPPSLHYHNYQHTYNVLKSCLQLAKEEGVTDKTDLELLATAALFHDCGYTMGYDNHEEVGCSIAQKVLPGFGYSEDQIKTICDMIMMTKLPSKPQTLLQRILCDADLDYLGRDDFKEVGDRLYSEFKEMGKVSDRREWDEMQVRFLQGHHYYTNSAINKRWKKKKEHLDDLIMMMKVH